MAQNILKSYFRVVVKPIAIVAVLFILIGMVSLTYWPDMRPDPSFTPEMRVKELERLSSPLFLMTGLFTGNFGYSSRTRGLVSAELSFRWPNTLLLVGVSIVATAAVGFVLGLFFKPRRQKPQVYAHALRNFLFGSSIAVAFMLLWVFVFEPYVAFGSRWFPLGGRLSIPPPTDPSLYLIDVLWHLVLPASTLTFVGVFRTLLILWSSGTPFTGKSRLKRSVYPFTTIDFALFVSAAVLVEYIFSWPGLGSMLLMGLQAADLNAALAAFVLLLALGAGLGLLSTLLDFIQIFLGLRQSLEQEANHESKTIEQPRHGDLTFVKALWKRKSLIVGAAILVCFVLSALLAPRDAVAYISGNDVFSQVAYATGVTLSIALPISILAVALGLAIGFVAGYFQGWVDNLIMIFTDAIVIVPALPFLLVFVYALGRNMLFTLVPSFWFLVAITVTASRNVYLRRSKGRKFKGTAPKGVLISIVREFGANLCLTTASVVLLSIAIDFLGFGDPSVVSWGKILFYAFGHGALQNLAWWWFLPPILGIGLLALGLLLLGYGLDDD